MPGILKQLAVAAMESSLLKSKFRGCILGSLVGDCLGSPYEGEEITPGDKVMIQRYFDTLEKPDVIGPIRAYTDDTAMTKSVIQCLTEKPEIDYKYLAKLFVTEFYNHPRRGYGSNVIDVFAKLRKTKFEDVFKPAQEQFGGAGSYGNGGAMRIAPIALFYHDNYNNMINVARRVTELTHTHPLAIHGALLQCIAVHQALYCDPKEKLDCQEFCEMLIEKMQPIENGDDDIELKNPQPKPYYCKIKTMQHFLSAPYNDEYDDEVILTLGNSLGAVDSVVTAVFCFLRAQSEIQTVENDNVYRRAIQYAITLGGDTDTIASMAGAIAGAYLGEESINKNTLKYCEFSKGMQDLTDDLAACVTK